MLPSDKNPLTIPIFAAQKIIADLSSGLYRSPAAALKELIANAYDADAEKVVVTTDPPHFQVIVVRDTGSGMSLEKFVEVMQHIGGSRKRILYGDVTPKGRQMIGRIGIGLLAIAQLGFRFYVSSSVEGDPTRFVAEVNLTPFHKDDAALHSKGLLDDSDKVEIGSLTLIRDIPEERNAHYTVITIPDVKKGIISEISGAVKKIIGVPEKLSIASKRIDKFEELVEVVRSSKRAYTALDGYYYMLWELALLCPVNYLDNGPFDTSRQSIEHVDSIQLPHIQSFKVIVDGIEIRRPQLFPTSRTEPLPDPIIYPLNFDHQIAGRRLRFSGYIYSQQAQIEPDELKGLHIRIRNVGVGRYDKSWLGYPFDEDVHFGQISGEIYVEDGLESALNIDRDSFIETHVHYLAMRAYMWSILRNKILPDLILFENKLPKIEVPRPALPKSYIDNEATVIETKDNKEQYLERLLEKIELELNNLPSSFRLNDKDKSTFVNQIKMFMTDIPSGYMLTGEVNATL